MTTVTLFAIHDMSTDWRPYLPYMEEEVLLRVQRMRRKEDRQRTICAHLLAKMTVSQTHQIPLPELHFTKDKSGKYQTGHENVHFNVSHAGDYVACAVSSRPVGIDIEQHVPRDFLLFQTLWSEEEKRRYPLQETEAFYALWTAKESYGKYKGFGLHPSLAQTTIRQDGSIHHAGAEQARIIPFSLMSHYSAAVCLEDSLESITQCSWTDIATFYEKSMETSVSSATVAGELL